MGGVVGGVVGGLFGGEEEQSSSSRVVLPDYIEGPFREALRLAQEAAATPFIRYETDDRFANFSPDELEAFGLTRDFVGQTAPRILGAADDLGAIVQQGLEGVNPDLIQAYINPYTENVLDTRRERYLEDLDRQRRDIRQQQGAIGAFGGSRSAIAEQNALREGYEGLNILEAQELSNAYQQGLAGAERGLTRAGQAITDQANLANLAANRQFQDIGALLNIGSQQRALEQADRDFDFSEFLREEGYPYQQAQFLSGIVQPAASIVRGTDQETTSRSTPGLGQLGLQAAGLVGGFGGFGGTPTAGVSSALSSYNTGNAFDAYVPQTPSYNFGSDPYNLFGGRTYYEGGLASISRPYAEGGVASTNPLSSAIDNTPQPSRLDGVVNLLKQGLSTISNSTFGKQAREVFDEGVNTVGVAGLGLAGLGEQGLNYLTKPREERQNTPFTQRIADYLVDEGDLRTTPTLNTASNIARAVQDNDVQAAVRAITGEAPLIQPTQENLTPTSVPVPPRKPVLPQGVQGKGTAPAPSEIPEPVQEFIQKGNEGALSTREKVNTAIEKLNKQFKREKSFDPRWLAFAAGAGKGRNFSESLGYAIDSFLSADATEEAKVLSKEQAIRQLAAEEVGLDTADLKAANYSRQLQSQELRDQIAQAKLPYEIQKLQASVRENQGDTSLNKVVEGVRSAITKELGGNEGAFIQGDLRQKVIDNVVNTRAQLYKIPPQQLAEAAGVTYGGGESVTNPQAAPTRGRTITYQELLEQQRGG